MPPQRLGGRSALRAFLRSEAAGGVLLMGAAALALIVANSPLHNLYHHALHEPIGPVLTPKLGPMTAHLWINDGLMAVFFLLVGLEIKRELVDGRLATWSQRRLPFIAAASGMIVPAAIYLAATSSRPGLANGWAIPAATDIAFAIGVLALLGRRAPTSLKLFLTTVAIVDDMGAVAIIAFAYSASIDLAALGAATAILLVMFVLNRMGVRTLRLYLPLALCLWYAMLLSGVHATIAGVLAAAVIPIIKTPGTPDSAESPLHRLEHAIAPVVAFFIVPLFGFASRLRGATWLQIYGVSLLCGIGFTMSLFIGALAFPASPELIEEAKIGVLIGSFCSALAGFMILRLAPLAQMHKQAEAAQDDEISAEGDVRQL